jgi:hypothetical protein
MHLRINFLSEIFVELQEGITSGQRAIAGLSSGLATAETFLL